MNTRIVRVNGLVYVIEYEGLAGFGYSCEWMTLKQYLARS